MAREQFSHAGVLRQTPGKLRFSEQNGTDLSQRGPVSTEKYTKLYDADWRKAQTDWQAYRLNDPLIAFQTVAHKGALGKSFSRSSEQLANSPAAVEESRGQR
jgi:hypothetical protein